MRATQNGGCVSQEGGEQAPPRLLHKTTVSRNVAIVCAIVDNCVAGMGGVAPPLPRRKTGLLKRSQALQGAEDFPNTVKA